MDHLYGGCVKSASGSDWCLMLFYSTPHYYWIIIERCAVVSDPVEEAKRKAGHAAVDEFVRDGMVLGIGSGSTVTYVVERLAQMVKGIAFTSHQRRYFSSITFFLPSPLLFFCLPPLFLAFVSPGT
jgi:hypothetical protein